MGVTVGSGVGVRARVGEAGTSVGVGAGALAAGVGAVDAGARTLGGRADVASSGVRLRTSSPPTTKSRPHNTINHDKRRRVFIFLITVYQSINKQSRPHAIG